MFKSNFNHFKIKFENNLKLRCLLNYFEFEPSISSKEEKWMVIQNGVY